LKKKNQKTFTLWHAYRALRTRQLTDESFLVLFFEKELLPCLLFSKRRQPHRYDSASIADRADCSANACN
jgi:hypothetical protein